MTLRVERLQGENISAHLTDLGQLRVTVFREFPYLYEGSLDYETKYLRVYSDCPRALVVLAWDDDECVGASTVIPLAEAPSDMQRPFVEQGHDLSRIDYFGESVVLRPYRGRGLGVRFFEAREAHARELGLAVCAFCAVQRPADHPLRPADYVPNDAFWERRGYRPAPDLTTSLGWLDVGESASTPKPMLYWTKQLG